MTTVTKTQLFEILQSGTHTVTFTKVDGTTTTRKVTLDPAVAPRKTTLTEATRSSEAFLNAYDCEKPGWIKINFQKDVRI
jgi:WYL_2, Sm-like SH3 beta-barrel fold